MTTEQSSHESQAQSSPPHDLSGRIPGAGELDLHGMLEGLKLPGFDLDGFVRSRRADIDAVTRGTSAAFVGAQTIVEKQAELFKTVLTEVADELHKLPHEAAKPVELLHKQEEFAAQALSIALASMKQIAETVSKSQAELLENVSHQVHRNVDEIRRLAKQR